MRYVCSKNGPNKEEWLVTAEALAILIWMAICQLQNKHAMERQFRERTVKHISACDIIIKLDSLQSRSKSGLRSIQIQYHLKPIIRTCVQCEYCALMRIRSRLEMQREQAF